MKSEPSKNLRIPENKTIQSCKWTGSIMTSLRNFALHLNSEASSTSLLGMTEGKGNTSSKTQILFQILYFCHIIHLHALC